MVKIPVRSQLVHKSLVIRAQTLQNIWKFIMDVYPRAQQPPRSLFQLGFFKEEVNSYGRRESLILQKDLSQRRVPFLTKLSRRVQQFQRQEYQLQPPLVQLQPQLLSQPPQHRQLSPQLTVNHSS